MLKFVNWLSVYTATYWSMTIACLLLLFAELTDYEQRSPELQADPAQGEGPPIAGQAEQFGGQAEQFDAAAAQELAIAEEDGSAEAEQPCLAAQAGPVAAEEQGVVAEEHAATTPCPLLSPELHLPGLHDGLPCQA